MGKKNDIWTKICKKNKEIYNAESRGTDFPDRKSQFKGPKKGARLTSSRLGEKVRVAEAEETKETHKM